jgi:hypothetical protein
MVGKELSGSKTDSGASTSDYHDFIGEILRVAMFSAKNTSKIMYYQPSFTAYNS